MSAIVFICILIIPTVAYARSISIPSVDITAVVHQDGTVSIEEKRTINFKGQFTFGEYDLFFEDGISIQNFTFADEEIPYQLTTSHRTDPHTYRIENLHNGIRVYYYFEADHEVKTFTYAYEIHNAVKIYEDMGHFYWELQGDDWDFEISAFNAIIKWESPIAMEDYFIWAHGPLWGEVQPKDEMHAKLWVEGGGGGFGRTGGRFG